MGRASRRRSHDRPLRARFDQRHRHDARNRDRNGRERPAEHLRAGPQPDVHADRRGHRVSARAQGAGRRHVRDRFFGLSRLPRRHHEGAASRAQSRHGQPLRAGNAADVARQGRHVASGRNARRRSARRAGARGNAYVLRRRARRAARVGLRLRRMPGVQAAQARLRSVPRGRESNGSAGLIRRRARSRAGSLLRTARRWNAARAKRRTGGALRDATSEPKGSTSARHHDGSPRAPSRYQAAA
ncbi:hypothetical protein PT2222_10162 [Paraburkholderia tropica]